MATAFTELDVKELRRSAVEDFAVEIEKDAKAKDIITAFGELGIGWDDYVAQHPEHKPVVPEPTVVVAADVTAAPIVVEEVTPMVAPQVRTKTPEVVSTEDTYLVKMNRDNPYFEFGRYKFTQKNPYNIMDAESTTRILKEEEGFAIAGPDELAEFYS